MRICVCTRLAQSSSPLSLDLQVNDAMVVLVVGYSYILFIWVSVLLCMYNL